MCVPVTDRRFDASWGVLVDVDVLEDGWWTGLFQNDGRLWIRTPNSTFPAPGGVDFPLLRILRAGRLVLVNPRTTPDRANAWILSEEGREIHSFLVGDGVEDVLADDETIVVTYFDEGVFRSWGPGYEGVAVFSNSGDLRFGYRSALGSGAVSVDHCQAACWVSLKRIAFFAYSDYALVTFDLETWKHEVWGLPEAWRDDHAVSIEAISCAGDRFLLGEWEGFATTIYAWSGHGEPVRIGEYPARLRGLRGGRFIARGAGGFEIVTFDV